MLIDVKPRGRSKRGTVVTARVRASLQALVDNQIENIGDWLRQTATGLPKVDAEGKPIVDNQGSVVWVNKPDPATAVKLVNDLAEYVIPKLSRSEQSAVVRIEEGHLDVAAMTTEDLKRFVLRQAGVDSIDALTVEAEPVPDWMEPKD